MNDMDMLNRLLVDLDAKAYQARDESHRIIVRQVRRNMRMEGYYDSKLYVYDREDVERALRKYKE